MLALSPEPWTRLSEMHDGSPYDIREVVRSSFGRTLAAGTDLPGVATAVGKSALPIEFAETALAHLAVFSAAEVEAMMPALESEDPKRRLAAMTLLNSEFITPERRASWLEALRKDPNVTVKEKASSLSRRVANGLPTVA